MFVAIWGKNILDRGKCEYKSSDNGMCLVYSINSKKTREESSKNMDSIRKWVWNATYVLDYGGLCGPQSLNNLF